MSSSSVPEWAEAVCAGVNAAGSRHVVYVPDNPLSHVLGVLRDRYPAIQTTLATREEEGFGIAAGLYVGGVRPTMMLQSSGLGNSLNALTSLLLPFQIPVLMVISMRGEDGEWNAAQVPMGRAVGPILDSIGIPHLTIDRTEAAAGIVQRVAETAFGSKLPGAVLLSRRMTASDQAAARERREPGGAEGPTRGSVSGGAAGMKSSATKR